jgi:putative SOS response-associated peptidase YedK
MAGILSYWRDPAKPDDEWLRTMAIITIDAHFAPGEVHDRAPAMLTPDVYDLWMDPDTDKELAVGAIRTSSHEFSKLLAHRTVSPRVNSVRNNDSALLDPVEN